MTLEDRLLEGKVFLRLGLDKQPGPNESPLPYNRTVERSSTFTLMIERVLSCLVRMCFIS